MARPPKTKETTEEVANELITVANEDGETLDIHPDTEDDHKRLGYERA